MKEKRHYSIKLKSGATRHVFDDLSSIQQMADASVVSQVDDPDDDNSSVTYVCERNGSIWTHNGQRSINS